jgi:hypothetical protein
MSIQFTCASASKDDTHGPLLDAELTYILCFEYERRLSNDYTVRFENRPLQIPRQNRDRPRPGKQVTMKKKLDGTIHVYWKDKPLKIKELLPNKEVRPSASGIA